MSSDDPRITDGWRDNQWFCISCSTTIRRNHKTVHLRSLKHRTAAARYKVMGSDLAFELFLAGVDIARFSPEERRIYRAALKLAKGKAAWAQAIATGRGR